MRPVSLRWFCVAFAAMLTTATAMAQTFPSHPIKLLVGFGAGGATDMVARIYAQKLQDVLGVTVVVDNKPGAMQFMALQPVKTGQPDGYTLVFTTASALVQTPGVRAGVPYDPIKDFTPVAYVAKASAVFYVNPSLPVKTMADLIAYAKENPGKLNYASAGVGAANHLQMEALMNATGIKLTHVPYKSDSEVSQQVAAGTVQLGLSTPQFPGPLATAGKVRLIAVTGDKRLAGLPDVPSLAESGVKGFDYYVFYAVMGPPGMPPAVIDKLNEAINKVSQMPDMQERLRTQLMLEPEAWTPAAYRDYLAREVAKWREMGKTIKIAD